MHSGVNTIHQLEPAAEWTADPAVHPAWIEVDLGRLEQNLARVRAITGDAAIIASVKANAYGHGVLAVSRTLERAGCEMLATGSFREAVALRDGGVNLPILMFGHCLPQAYPALIRKNLIPTLHAPGQAEALNEAAGQHTVDAFIKVDAGLGRLGYPIDTAEAAIIEMARLPRLSLKGLYTHLPFSTSAQRDQVRDRFARFAELVARLRRKGIEFEFVQANASAGLLSGLEGPFNAVCPGHALYGLDPGAEPLATSNGIEPILRGLRARLVQVGAPNGGGSGPSDGYGSAASAKRRGVVPIGQAQGLTSAGVSNRQEVLVGGRRLQVVGISFEHAVVDLNDSDAVAGDVVTFIGCDGEDSISIQEFAHWRGGTIKDALSAISGRLGEIFL